MHGNECKTGSFAATGVAVNIQLGYIPKRVLVFNETDSIKWSWTDTMADGKGFKEAQNGDTTYEAANGISAYAGTAGGNAAGFTLGTGVAVNAKTLHWIAER